MGMIKKMLGREMSTDVLDLLTAQHADVDALFEQLMDNQGSDRRAAFSELANKLAAHATVEERIFYPAVMTRDTHALLHESVEEHLAIKRVLADLLALRLDDESFAAKLKVLKESVAHHAHEEEENKLFPLVKDAMTGDERGALGNEVLVMFEDLMQAQPSASVPAETKMAASLPPLA
jgi:hemerythrin superfamily protein